jgi:spermidine/putrescine transport system permease protein
VTPEVNAASTLLMALTIVLTVIGLRMQGRTMANTRGND